MQDFRLVAVLTLALGIAVKATVFSWIDSVGVAPPEFRGTTVGLVYDLWMPITLASEMGGGPTLSYRGCRDLTSTMVRLKPGLSLDPAQAEVSALAKRLAAEYPAPTGAWMRWWCRCGQVIWARKQS